MKTVITTSGNTLDAAFDKRFGRAAWFCLLSAEEGTAEFLLNNHNEDGNGAGTKAAEKMVELGVEKVISGDFGPKAKDLLAKFNVQMVVLQDELTVADIINKLKK